MERNFNIDKKYLYSILNILKEYQSDEDVLADIFKLERIINRFENHFYEDKEESLKESIDGDLKRYEYFKPFYPLAEKFINIGINVDDISFEATYSALDISDNEAFSTVSEFFNEQSEFFSSGFNEFNEEAEEHLEFIDKDNNTDGEMTFLKSTGDAFVFCPNYSNITKITILTHETEHVIDSFKNPNFYENLLIRETVAIFMEMIVGDFCAKKYNLIDDHFQRKLMLHIVLKNHANIFIDKMDMLEIIDKNIGLTESELIKLLEDEGFSFECINFLMENTIIEDFFYILSYLIAIEIYFMYYNDKSKALSILEDIILNGTDENILSLISKYGIVLNKNVKNYEDKILSKIKKQ